MTGIILYLLVPSKLVLVFMCCGLILWLIHGIKRLTVVVFAIGSAMFIIFGIGPISYYLIGKLESQYPALISDEKIDQIDKIVVLSGHALPDSYFPISSKVSSSTAFRLAEAMRLWKQIPKSEIIISGHGNVPEIMKEFLVSIGLPSKRIAIEDQSATTYENAINIKKKINKGPFILITSAGHMPRAMGVFKKLNLNPIPAPTDFMVGNNPMAAKFFPTIQHLMYSDMAMHEYIGILWYRLRDRI